MSEINIKRIYQKPNSTDGMRILVDGLWPRGLKKEAAKIDLWLKEIAPSAELRRWFKHESGKWPEFCQRYTQELNFKKESVQILLDCLKKQTVTLIYGSKEEKFNNAVALKEYLENQQEIPDKFD